ncbi:MULTISPECIES: hypothetical protein [unclassified Cupriavidus]|uniref:hypothetical protein n=1 Tax=Cupriavidus sp. H19C3 TaxID=3241603 RepID=UPI003BF90266
MKKPIALLGAMMTLSSAYAYAGGPEPDAMQSCGAAARVGSLNGIVRKEFMARCMDAAYGKGEETAAAQPESLRGDEPFTGSWFIDLRKPQEQKDGLDCGSASFDLVQRGNQIIGSHDFSAVYCGRLNEGGWGTVHGVVNKGVAVLVVVSGRNGGANVGTATVGSGKLRWRSVAQIRGGDQEGDSPLILFKGDLRRDKR